MSLSTRASDVGYRHSLVVGQTEGSLFKIRFADAPCQKCALFLIGGRWPFDKLRAALFTRRLSVFEAAAAATGHGRRAGGLRGHRDESLAVVRYLHVCAISAHQVKCTPPFFPLPSTLSGLAASPSSHSKHSPPLSCSSCSFIPSPLLIPHPPPATSHRKAQAAILQLLP
ncbi:hypothetical protein BC939DRAFT_65304 [Gamsiella multidivaricata]|uniref:uncharacterized protein n=1 Tax=Gamsiella multidivaricata TaxID=101098 RepID=UPI00221FDB1E|nr:uncharacterized protein BC939DRAFT_65304 [Gamsiella multidivaricata]KAI7816087.1 hypothetical protein BC939DRAFT_65304 [Gamsiella multidivaricata]